jgi:hypothetical protein
MFGGALRDSGHYANAYVTEILLRMHRSLNLKLLLSGLSVRLEVLITSFTSIGKCAYITMDDVLAGQRANFPVHRSWFGVVLHS